MKKLSKVLLILALAIGGIMVGGGVMAGFGAPPTDAQGILGVSAEQGFKGNSLMDVVKSFINWLLGLLSLISLVILLYGGFNMVTAAGDDGKYKKGFKILQQAAVGLAIIGLSWIIVSFIFFLIGGAQKGQVGS